MAPPLVFGIRCHGLIESKFSRFILLLFFVVSISSPAFTAEFQNGPYKHVSPTDVGTKIGVGVVAQIPVIEYSGDTTLTTSVTIENKVINGCLVIDADNVTVRNSIINCNSNYPLKIINGRGGSQIEYSKINCSSSGKVFYFPSGAPDTTVAYNEAIGCQDFFFMNGNLDGLQVKNNYMHTLVGLPAAHADGFQIGTGGASTGNIHIQGNYFDADNLGIGKTDIIFAVTNSAVEIIYEDNYIEPWGHYTHRCHGDTKCIIRNNVFSQAFDGIEQNLLLANATRVAEFACNRYANGEFVKDSFNNQTLIHGAQHNTDNCPDFNTKSDATIVPVIQLLLD